MEVALREIAFARSGDKAGSANIGVIAYTEEGYAFLYNALTSDNVHCFFRYLHPEKTTRFELPNLLAFNFVLDGVLEGGGGSSLALDAQGKALGQILLEMPLEIGQGRQMCKKL